MATTSQNLAASVSLAIGSTGITVSSLPNATGRGSIVIDNGTAKAVSADIALKLKTGASGVTATGYFDIYLIRSDDGTLFEDNYGGGAADAAFTPVNATKIGIMSAVANATTYTAVFNTSMFGELPRKFAIGVVNNTGGTTDATTGSFSVTYTLKKFDTA